MYAATSYSSLLDRAPLRAGVACLGLLLLGAQALACTPLDDTSSTSLSRGETDSVSTEAGADGDDPQGGSEGGTSTSSATADPDATTGGDATTGDPDAATTTGLSGATSEGGATTGDTGEPLVCNGKIYACNDGEDNDGDGLIDEADPECIGPCDDDEETFKTGLPGDNVDCKQDCFFDGNSGQGDDGCNWDLRCDPESPGENLGCGFKDGPQCKDGAHDVDEQCVAACSGVTPPGCDCFGCCTVDTVDGPVDIYLNSPGCSLDNLDACSMCTPSEECGNPCDPDDCELCFGETELPDHCDVNNCGDAQACTVDEQGESDCVDGEFCLYGCCYPLGVPE